MEERTKESVSAFLTEVKGWGWALKAFYVDGCEAYRSAIGDVFPDAVVQYDYFHVIQSIWRKLWKAGCPRPKDLKAPGEAAETPAYSARLLSLAKRIWENRYLFFKRDENLAEKEREELPALMEEDPFLAKVRGFVKGVWGIFQDSTTEEEATLRLAALKLRPEVEPGSAFAKAIAFLEGRFPDMVAFLRHQPFQGTCLAENLTCSIGGSQWRCVARTGECRSEAPARRGGGRERGGAGGGRGGPPKGAGGG